MDILKLIPAPYDDILIMLLMGVTIYFVWRSSKNKQVSETIANYEAVTKSQEMRIAQLEKDFQKSQADNHELRAQVNQLIGENKTLRDVVARPDAAFQETVTKILDEMKRLSQQQNKIVEKLSVHFTDDDVRFAEVGGGIKEAITEIKANRDFYAKTLKEFR